jgi:hypothetical protein
MPETEHGRLDPAKVDRRCKEVRAGMQAAPNFAMLGPQRPERIPMRPFLCLIALGAAVSAALPARAALPPHYQRLAELQAVLADLRVGRAFEGMPIERVEYVRRDLYRVSAGRCRLDVIIVDLPTPPDVVGGRRFAPRPGTKVCGK